jgi:type I restriction enzyme S subunit
MLHKADYVEDGIPLVNPMNIIGAEIVPSTKMMVSEATKRRLENYVLRKGDVVIARRGELGRCAVVTDAEDGWLCGTGSFFVRLPDTIDAHYFTTFFRSNAVKTILDQNSIGTTMSNLNHAILNDLEIPIPPLKEQRRIMNALDEAFDAIDLAKSNANKTLSRTRALFTKFLDLAFVKLAGKSSSFSVAAIADIKGGKRTPNGYKLEFEPTPYPYLRVTDFSDDGSIDQSDLRYVSEAVHAGIKRYVISSRDLYISIAGTIGKTGIIPPELEGANLTENACRLIFKEGMLNTYFYLFTRTSWFAEQMGLNTRTTAQPKLALSRLATIMVPKPSLEEQRNLVAESELVSLETARLSSIYGRKLNALEDLRHSLVQRAFSGNL